MKLRSALLCFSLFAKLGFTQHVVPSDGVGAMFTAPLSPVTLQVSVTDDSGQPLQASVLFVAPTIGAMSGPGGEFTPGLGDTQSRVKTGADGIAAAQFYPNGTPGPYLVSAWVEGSSAATHLAITNTNSAGLAADPKSAMQAIQDGLKPGGGTNVYGPFLLDSGTVVRPAVSTAGVDPLTVSNPAIFFWLDDNPMATYDHPVRWVTMDASLAFTAVDRLWTPYIAPPGGGGYGLIAPLYRLPTGAVLPADAAVSSAAKPVSRLRPDGDGSNTDACAILVFGPDSDAFEVGAAEMRDVFSNTLNIPDANIFEDTTPGFIYGTNHQASTRSRMHDLFLKAKAKNCKKLYFYFAGHGNNGNFCLLKQGVSGELNGELEDTPYTVLAQEIQGTKIPKACVIIQSCHSGSAIAALQGYGFDGEIATATDQDNLAYHNPVPGIREVYWTSSLASAWKGLGPGVTLTGLADGLLGAQMQATDFVTTHWILPGHPRTATIEAAGGMAVTPAQVVITNLDDAAINPVKITVNKPGNFTAGAGFVEMLIDDIAVAKDPGTAIGENNTRIMLAKDDASGTFTIKGLKEGSTPYTIKFTDRDQKTYTGKGIILVGTGYDVMPSPLQIKAGASGTVKITRSATLAKQSGSVKITIKPADATSAATATADSTELIYPPGGTSVNLSIKGVKAGTAIFTIDDGMTKKTFQVLVSSSSACPAGGTMQVAIVLKSDPFDSGRFVMMPSSAAIPFSVASGMLTLNSAVTQLPSGSGMFDATSCSGTIKTVSTGTIAGFRNVKVEYDVAFAGGGTTVSMTIREGTENTLNNEPQPVTYTAAGPVK